MQFIHYSFITVGYNISMHSNFLKNEKTQLHFMTQSTIAQLSSELKTQPRRKKHKLDIQKK